VLLIITELKLFAKMSPMCR